jgi:hypothetical protein
MERISDLGLAAALISRDFTMEGIDRDETGRACFLFTEDPDLEHGFDAYWGNNLDVDARTYFDNIKMLKGRIYAGK